MSMSLVRYQQQVNFAAPAALNADVVGTDADTGVNQFIPRAPNVLLDIKHDKDPAATISYTLYIRRQNLSRTRIGVTADFLTTFNGQVRPNMPRGVNPGFFQWVEQQTAGALTAQNYLVTWQQPLAV
jgi:hypothetical protein